MRSRCLALLALGMVACATTAAPSRPADRSKLAQLEAAVDTEGAIVGRAEGATLVVVFASWCPHCHKELDVIARLRPAHPALRVLGVNYKGHEEYGGRGSAEAVKRYVAQHAPWLRVVPVDDALFGVLGSPSKIPTLYVFDRRGELVEVYRRAERAMPDAEELGAVLRRIGV